MQTRNVLKATLLLGLVFSSCKSKKLDTSKASPRPAVGGSLSVGDKTQRLGQRIPLDAVGSPSPWLLTAATMDSAGSTLTGMYGLERQYAVVPDDEGLTLTAPAASREQFPGYTVISEKSPFGVEMSPAQRVFNLSDLLQRLSTESRWEGGVPSGKSRIPDGVSVFATSEVDLTVTVTRPTVIAVSFSTNRNVRISNRSKLVLVIPLMQNVTIEQQKSPEVGAEEPITEIHSFSCVQLERNGLEGKIRHFLLDSSVIGDPSRCDTTTADPDRGIDTPLPSKLALEAWAPLLLVTNRLRKESIYATHARFAPLFPISGMAVGGPL